MSRSVLSLLPLTTLAAVQISTPNPTILAFGDSWAWLGYDQFKEVFASHGMNTALRAIPGTPAGYWAVVEPAALVEAVDSHNASHVYLSIGGNDFLEGIPLGLEVHVLYAEMMAATLEVVNRLVKARPHVHIYHFGYEILDWSASSFCRSFGDVELHGKSPLFCPDTRNVSCMTHTQAKWLQHNYVDALAAEYAKNGSTARYHGLNLLGTLQAAAGVPGATAGHPVWEHYSPSKFVRKEDDALGCVHLTPAGYTELYTELAKHVVAVARQAERPIEEHGLMAAGASAATPAVAPSARRHAGERPCASNPRRQCSSMVGERVGGAVEGE